MRKHTPALIDAVRWLFPACVTEAKESDGQVRHAIDFDLLRQELSDCIIEVPTEHYQLNWPGKRAAMALAGESARKSFFPQPQESLNFETTQNLFIEGDKNVVIRINNRQTSANIQKVQERQNWPISSHLKPSGECKYNLDSEFCPNDDNCENDSVDRLHSLSSRMADKKITTTGN